MAQKKYTDAEPLLIGGYEGMKQRAALIPATGKIRLKESVERIVKFYRNWSLVEPGSGKSEKAAWWEKELQTVDREGR
jgi:non-specific serine/threonine protein kinase/serine/threonine-protein kinase